MGCCGSRVKDDEEERRRMEEERRRREEEEKRRLEEEEKKKQAEDRERKKRLKRGDRGEELKEEGFDHRDPDQDQDTGYEDEIHDGENYGKPIRIGTQTWLTYDFKAMPDTSCPKVFCPRGWRIPSTLDYLLLFKTLGEDAYHHLTDKERMNMDPNKIYVTTDKSMPYFKYGIDDESWKFKSVMLDRDENGNKIERAVPVEDVEIENALSNNNEIMKDLEEAEEEEEEPESDFVRMLNDELKLKKPDSESTGKSSEKTEELKEISKKDESETQEVGKKDINPDGEGSEKYQDNEEEESVLFNPFLKKVVVEKPPEKRKGPYKIYDVNTFLEKENVYCKLIANEVLGMDFVSDIVGEATFKMFFQVPKVYNISKFEWDFADGEKSKNRVAAHTFEKAGEYEVKLDLILYSKRHFILTKKIWVIDEIEYGDDEKHGNIIHGTPIKLGKQIWMDRDAYGYMDYKMDLISLQRGKGKGQYGENSYLDSVTSCPKGWRLPLKEDIEELLRYGGRSLPQKLFFLAMREGFAAKVNQSGIYDAICLDFMENSTKSLNISPHRPRGPLLLPEQTKEENSKELTTFDKGVIDPHFLAQLQNYDEIIVKSLNFKDIFNKEAYCLRIDNDKVFISTRSTGLNSNNSFFSTRYIACEHFDFDIGLTSDYVPAHQPVQFDVNLPNVISYEWDFGDFNAAQNGEEVVNIKNPTYTYTYGGEYIITAKLVLFGGRINSVKKKIWVHTNVENYSQSKFLGFKQIQILPLPIFKVKRNDMMHFTHQSAPICKSFKSCFYLAFNDMHDLKAKVVHVDIQSGHITPPLHVVDYGLPLDIIATNSGFALLMKDLRDENTLYLQSVTDQGKVLFTNCIMQNGALPLRAEHNQLMFFEPNTTQPVFGMNAMHKPFSGRLEFGKNRILVIFSYTNYFGTCKGERDDHMADTIVTYSEDGTEVHLASNWSTSHSLSQSTAFNGLDFFTASLGDALPHNIRILKIKSTLKSDMNRIIEEGILQEQQPRNVFKSYETADGRSIVHTSQPDLKFDHYFPRQNKMLNNNDMIHASLDLIRKDEATHPHQFTNIHMNIRHDYVYTHLLDGVLPGDMRGKSSGRMSEMLFLNNKLYLLYSRIPCMDSGETNNKDEFSLVMFDGDLRVERQVFFRKGDMISCLKAARYGENIFSMFSETEKRIGKYVIDYTKTDHKCSAFLMNQKGEMISDLAELPICLFNPSDSPITLEDGSTVWTYCDDNNNLYVCFLDIDFDISKEVSYKNKGFMDLFTFTNKVKEAEQLEEMNGRGKKKKKKKTKTKSNGEGEIVPDETENLNFDVEEFNDLEIKRKEEELAAEELQKKMEEEAAKELKKEQEEEEPDRLDNLRDGKEKIYHYGKVPELEVHDYRAELDEYKLKEDPDEKAGNIVFRLPKEAHKGKDKTYFM